MTIFGTPAGTPLNQSGGFQGTTPGNPVQAGLQTVQPGVGMFPPNSNNNSGDSVMAACSRAAVPVNVQVGGFGVPGSGGKPVLAGLGGAGAKGTGTGFVANGGSANNGPAGGNSFGAGGMNQTNAPGAGESSTIPHNAPASIITVPAQPSFRG